MNRLLCTASLLALVLSGCGGTTTDGPDLDATLTLDSAPNAVHAGIELAVARGFDQAEGVTLHVHAPGHSTDSVTLLLTGRTNFAILDLRDLAIARDKKKDIVGVMAIVENPLPDVEGKKVSLSGAPAYPELVLCTTRDTLQDDPALVKATVHALQRGYREAISDPESATEAVLAAAPGAKRADVQAQLDAVESSFQATDGTIGTLNTATLEKWATWEQRSGIVKTKPDVAQMFDPSFARSGVKGTKQEDG